MRQGALSWTAWIWGEAVDFTVCHWGFVRFCLGGAVMGHRGEILLWEVLMCSPALQCRLVS